MTDWIRDIADKLDLSDLVEEPQPAAEPAASPEAPQPVAAPKKVSQIVKLSKSGFMDTRRLRENTLSYVLYVKDNDDSNHISAMSDLMSKLMPGGVFMGLIKQNPKQTDLWDSVHAIQNTALRARLMKVDEFTLPGWYCFTLLKTEDVQLYQAWQGVFGEVFKEARSALDMNSSELETIIHTFWWHIKSYVEMHRHFFDGQREGGLVAGQVPDIVFHLSDYLEYLEVSNIILLPPLQSKEELESMLKYLVEIWNNKPQNVIMAGKDKIIHMSTLLEQSPVQPASTTAPESQPSPAMPDLRSIPGMENLDPQMLAAIEAEVAANPSLMEEIMAQAEAMMGMMSQQPPQPTPQPTPQEQPIEAEYSEPELVEPESQPEPVEPEVMPEDDPRQPVLPEDDHLEPEQVPEPETESVEAETQTEETVSPEPVLDELHNRVQELDKSTCVQCKDSSKVITARNMCGRCYQIYGRPKKTCHNCGIISTLNAKSACRHCEAEVKQKGVCDGCNKKVPARNRGLCKKCYKTKSTPLVEEADKKVILDASANIPLDAIDKERFNMFMDLSTKNEDGLSFLRSFVYHYDRIEDIDNELRWATALYNTGVDENEIQSLLNKPIVIKHPKMESEKFHLVARESHSKVIPMFMDLAAE